MPGAQGRVLAVLAETTAELNLRTIAQLSGVSQAQASRVLPRLVDLGIVERREVPPSSLFRLVPEHVAARVVLDLARAADTVLDEIGRMAQALPFPPTSVIVFGSFARREAGPRQRHRPGRRAPDRHRRGQRGLGRVDRRLASRRAPNSRGIPSRCSR